ncbi:TDT family transporter [Pyrococcus abyssi]|uniref:C4-dicarboxylate transporter, putative n=1 Tax=Pyrococcus abyssi (strain GE5 / Orsay) TaxID=272844 RepID=Q9V0I5_PYRAB|nr:tellurite-resistance/dicarboxylate transporter [Pyrococcus abyssi]CAB49718.1 mae1-like C4-dicarboxylate transporter, putative [Pyrococcus abyssi GE5]CCE70204.1 TPA: C4-dicarboxylate transporter, putative [Pyrococcus abyssi GE5]
MRWIREFPPSWFASVMGTGALALVSLAYSSRLDLLKNLSIFLTYLNTLVFFLLLIPWILRWVLYKENAIKDLKHPMMCHFYGTIGIAMLVLSADYLMILGKVNVAKTFWTLGTGITIFFSLLIPYLMFIEKEINVKNITPAWFIPPVGLIVIPLTGAPLLSHFSGITKEVAYLINYFSWGSGFFLYLALFAIVMYRFILHEPLPCGIAPAIWINLGPIGAGTSTLYALIKNNEFIRIKEPLLVLGLIFWGFGVWWLAMAILMTLYYIRNLNLPYSLAWWAFIFPLGAYVSATHNVAVTFGIGVIDSFGFTLYWFLLLLWVVTGIKTLKAIAPRRASRSS